MKEAKKQDSPSRAEPQLRDTAEQWGQADRQQRGGFSKAVPRLKVSGILKLVAPHCWRPLTPGIIFFIDIYLILRLNTYMHIITRKRLMEFAKKHPDCSTALESWYRIVKQSDFNSFMELRQTFPRADKVGNLTVFNIGGKKARLIAAIHFNTHRIYIRHILTHEEYDRGSWRK